MSSFGKLRIYWMFLVFGIVCRILILTRLILCVIILSATQEKEGVYEELSA